MSKKSKYVPCEDNLATMQSKYFTCEDNLVKIQTELENAELLAKQFENDKNNYRETTFDLKYKIDNLNKINQLDRVQQTANKTTIDRLTNENYALTEENKKLKGKALRKHSNKGDVHGKQIISSLLKESQLEEKKREEKQLAHELREMMELQYKNDRSRSNRSNGGKCRIGTNRIRNGGKGRIRTNRRRNIGGKRRTRR
jgi:hypothetical protein